MAYPRIDTSPLFMPPRPSALSQGLGQVGDIMTAFMARKREQERQAILDQQKAEELQFRKDQEERLTKRQEMLDTREDNRLQAQETRAQEDRRLKGYEAVGKAKPQDRAFLAQLYGGELGQATPDYRQDPNDPLSKNIDFLENVEEDDSTPLGFSYGVNPEHERRTAQAANTQTLTMPGGKPIALPNAEEEQDFYGRYGQTLAMDPMQAVLMRRVEEAKALGLDPEKTAALVNQERQRAQQAALRKKTGSGGPKKADPRLELLDKEGNVTGQGRSPGESEASRKLLPSLVAARKAGEELKGHIGQYKNISKLNPMDWISGDVDQQAVRDQLIDRLVGARKEITGALNAEDVIRYKKQLDTAMGRGPEAVSQAIDSFVRELENMYDAKVMSARAGGGRAPAPKGNSLDAEADELLKGIR